MTLTQQKLKLNYLNSNYKGTYRLLTEDEQSLYQYMLETRNFSNYIPYAIKEGTGDIICYYRNETSHPLKSLFSIDSWIMTPLYD